MNKWKFYNDLISNSSTHKFIFTFMTFCELDSDATNIDFLESVNFYENDKIGYFPNLSCTMKESCSIRLTLADFVYYQYIPTTNW